MKRDIQLILQILELIESSAQPYITFKELYKTLEPNDLEPIDEKLERINYHLELMKEIDIINIPNRILSPAIPSGFAINGDTKIQLLNLGHDFLEAIANQPTRKQKLIALVKDKGLDFALDILKTGGMAVFMRALS